MDLGLVLVPGAGDRVDEQFLLVVFMIETSDSHSFMVRVWRAWVSTRGNTRVTTIPA